METKKELLSQMLTRFIEGNAIPLRQQHGVMRLPVQPGALFEINQETYDHFIETVPPMFMGGHLFCYIQGIPSTLFRRKGGFFVRQLTPADAESFWGRISVPERSLEIPPSTTEGNNSVRLQAEPAMEKPAQIGAMMNSSKIPVEEFVDSLMSRNARPATPNKRLMPLPTTTGVVFEINEATFNHYLEALPTSIARREWADWFFWGRSKSLFARREARYYCRRLTAEELRQFWSAVERS